ncbi:penicillin-binding transpeptidase domain-containing protein [Clostridium sp. Cult3]|uniref:penicillin-binding transpeptidase domain-containing protein n=1 Tax=Clostridium sp. Cult3 TaxID=2079004 RepID=UPI001F48376D|nr:penicillin-binding transpeptidase domain-containing protein [Clostridium sp. Cult3]MCF6460000.1 stage V sporulation protein D [Clostridium sp. Cult3]
MVAPSNASKKRLVFVFVIVLIAILALIIRLGYIQIVTGEELKKGALEQWTRGIEIKSKRGIIYDKNGKKLAISVSSYTVWASPADVEDPKDTAKKVAEVLDMDENLVYEKITKKVDAEKIKQWISKEEAKELRNLKLSGINVVDDNKRFYPYEDFASYILGFTNIDNDGLYGIEKTYDKYLSGSPGRWIKTTDASGKQMPYDGEKVFEAQDGLNVVLTIDETIQHFAEKAAMESIITTKAKNVSIIIMEPKTGDILAMANLPQYNPNSPREPLDEMKKDEWRDLPIDELEKRWYDMWRNFAINDAYEPGSTFKTIVAAAAIEENIASIDSNFYCNGFIRDIPGALLKCSRWYNPHGPQTLKEGMENSCNVVFVDLGRKLGKEKFYKYIKAFGFGEPTGIELTGEQGGIIPYSTDIIKEVNLATMSYGHGIAVTPIQLVNAISAIANGGNLMEPRLVSHLVDNEGNVVMVNEPKIKRQVISKSTSDIMLDMMESVVMKGTGTNAYVPGYRVAGKTGTAQKIIDGKYAPGKYIGSFVAVAPADDPQIALLVIVDEPQGVYYGGSVAAPVAGKIIEETLNYLEIKPEFTEEEKEQFDYIEEVPDVRNKTIEEAGRILMEHGFKYTTDSCNISEKSKVIDQFPLPGTEVSNGSIIDLYLNEDQETQKKIIMPDLMGKSREDVIKILEGLNLKYHFKGEGNAIEQNPEPGTEVDINSNVEVEFSNR